MNNRWLNIVLIFMLCAVSVANVHAQNVEDTKVTIDVEKITMSEFLNKLSEVAKISISFSGSTTDKYTITLAVKDQTLKETLTQAFKNTPLQYTVMPKGIMVFEPEKKSGNQSLEAITVAGTVTDNSGNGLPGVSILLKETTRGTTTDANGKYSIEASENDVLIFSFIGYKKTEEAIGSRIKVDVKLMEDVSTLNEVVINGGYYETTDKLKTGSIVKVTAKEIENQPVTSPLMALQGRVAGLDITPNNGAPGNAPKIRIRGTNSLRIFGKSGAGVSDPEGDGNYPLYVIDGVPINSAPISGFPMANSFSAGGYDPISTISPTSIASIEVLKDGDATAVYGSRGANGVILITTKRNIKGTDRTSFNFTTYAGLGEISSKMELLNTKQYVSMRNEALRNDNLTPTIYDYDLTKWDTTRYTDWQKELLGGTSNISDVQGTISFGNQNTTFNLGLSYHKETLIFSNDFGYYRGSGNFSVNHTSKDQKFSIAVTANYGGEVNELFNGDFVAAALSLPPNAPKLHDENGELNWEIVDLGANVRQSTWINPLSYLQQTTKAVSKNFVANSNLSYVILPGITLATSIGYTDFINNEKFKSPISSRQPTFDNAGKPINAVGTANFTNIRRSSWIIEPKFLVTKTWGNHSLNTVLGTTWQESVSTNLSQTGERYLSDALLGSLKGAGNVDVRLDNFSEYRYASLYGRVGYIFNQRFILNLTARRDGSSRFGPSNKFANFWSIGSGWIFSNERAVKDNLKFLTFGKLRASYGVTGSDNIGDYKYYNLYETVPHQYLGVTGVVPSALNNPDYAWEITKKLEAGVELAFFENRISLEVSAYRNRSSNQLINYPLPAMAGFNSVLRNFEATIQNSGLEILLGSDVLSDADWRWSVSLNVSIPQNKLIEFENIEDSPYATIYKVGEPLSIQYLFIYRGVNPQSGLYQFADLNNDGFIRDEDDRKLVNALDKSVFGGLNNTIQYKGFELSFLIQFTKQNSLRDLSPFTPGYKFYNQPNYVLQRWQGEEDITRIQRFGTAAGENGPIDTWAKMTNSTYNFTDASFIRLKTVSFSYQLPSSFLEKVRLQQAKVFLQGQNLFTITKYQGLDPETKTSLPPLRIITAGVQLKI